jgi:CDP-glycerol glycerophosphotransferase (TagB/SpsB family)
MNYKFLIYISHSYSIPIGQPLEQEILSRGHQIMWFSDVDEGKQKLRKFDNVFNDIRQIIDYQPHVVLVATNTVADFITGIKVQIFHGFNAQKRPLKSVGFSHFKIRGFFDLYCTQGPSTTKPFQELAEKLAYFKVVETGWSKVDPLFPIEEKIASTAIPTILISSTFTEKLSLAHNQEIYAEIQRLIQTKQFNFMLILHPKMAPHIVNKWQKLNCKNFSYYDTTDLNPLFKKADILLADTTSAIQEFILQRKPAIAFDNKNNHNYLININQVEQLEKALKLDVANLDNIYHNMDQFIQQLHPYKDGKSSLRVIDACIKFLHEDKQDLKNKPYNWNRKLNVRKKLKYFTFTTYSRPFTLKKQ